MIFETTNSMVINTGAQSNILTSIAFEMDPDLQQIRQMPGYTTLDLLSNVGGLAFFLLVLGSMLVSLVYANQAQTHLVEHLFAYED